MINFEEMAKSHERLFPKADLNSQVIKLEEEIGEFEEALTDHNPEKANKELADVGVVCVGIYRFTPKVAKFIWRYAAQLSDANIDKAVERKWKINESRKWEWNGSTYHHVGKDGEE